MGFNGKAQKEAAKQQAEAMKMQMKAYEDSKQMFDQYRQGFTQRNASVIAQNQKAGNWLDMYNKGTDISKLNPALVQNGQIAANQVKQTMNFANKLGDRRGGDADFQAKLNSVSSREIAKGLAAMNEAGLMDELNSQRAISMDTSAFLNQDAQAGLGLQSNLFGMTGQIFQSASTRRQQEIQKAQMAMSAVMGLISGGISGAASVMTGGLSSGGRWAS